MMMCSTVRGISIVNTVELVVRASICLVYVWPLEVCPYEKQNQGFMRKLILRYKYGWCHAHEKSYFVHSLGFCICLCAAYLQISASKLGDLNIFQTVVSDTAPGVAQDGWNSLNALSSCVQVGHECKGQSAKLASMLASHINEKFITSHSCVAL